MKVPKYRRHSTRNKGFVEHKKKRIYFPGPYDSASSREGYRKFLVSIGMAATGPKPGEPLTVAMLCGEFMKWAAEFFGTTDDTRYSVYRAAVKQLVKDNRYDDAATFGPRKLTVIQYRMAEEKLSRSYINAVTGQIRYVFQWGVKEELIPAATLHALEAVPGLMAGRSQAKESPKLANVLWEDVEPVLAELPEVAANMVRFQWLVAFRSKSIWTATPEQFTKKGKLWEWKPKHKTEWRGLDVTIFIGPKCQKLLKPILAATKPGERLFPGYTTHSYCRAVTRAITRVNRKRAKEKLPQIARWTPHRLRHSRSQSVRDKFGIEAAQAYLAHESLSSTQLYSSRRLEMARAVAAEIG